MVQLAISLAVEDKVKIFNMVELLYFKELGVW